MYSTLNLATWIIRKVVQSKKQKQYAIGEQPHHGKILHSFSKSNGETQMETCVLILSTPKKITVLNMHFK